MVASHSVKEKPIGHFGVEILPEEHMALHQRFEVTLPSGTRIKGEPHSLLEISKAIQVRRDRRSAFADLLPSAKHLLGGITADSRLVKHVLGELRDLHPQISEEMAELRDRMDEIDFRQALRKRGRK